MTQLSIVEVIKNNNRQMNTVRVSQYLLLLHLHRGQGPSGGYFSFVRITPKRGQQRKRRLRERSNGLGQTLLALVRAAVEKIKLKVHESELESESEPKEDSNQS